MLEKPERHEYPDPVARYIGLVPDDGPVRDRLARQLEAALELLRPLSDADAAFRYAPGKWSIKDIAGHLIDGERMWGYRLLRIARSDPRELPGYDRDVFVAEARADERPLQAILAEYEAVRSATLALVDGIPEAAWTRAGSFAGQPLTARAAVYIVAGHELHHLQVIRDRYLPALQR